jgi:general L-amino acid transport system permease protein
VQLVFIYFAVFVSLPPVRESLQFPGFIYANQRGVYLPRPEFSSPFSVWLACVVIGILAAVVILKSLARFPSLERRLWLKGLAALVPLLVISALGWNLQSETPLAFEIPIRETFNFKGGIHLSPEFSAVLTGLVIYTAGFIAEVVRGGILAVRRGQIEAAMAVGLTGGQILRLITFPQALRVIIPPLTSQYLNLSKNSSLAIAIGFPDLFHVTSTIANQTGQPVPVIMLVMATYLAMSLFTSLLMNIYNRYVQILEK